MSFDVSCWPQVTQLLSQYLSTYELAPIFTEEEVLHYLMPVEGVIETHVVEGPGEPVLCRHMQYLHPCVGVSANVHKGGMSISSCLLCEQLFGHLKDTEASMRKSRHFCTQIMS